LDAQLNIVEVSIKRNRAKEMLDSLITALSSFTDAARRELCNRYNTQALYSDLLSDSERDQIVHNMRNIRSYGNDQCHSSGITHNFIVHSVTELPNNNPNKDHLLKLVQFLFGVQCITKYNNDKQERQATQIITQKLNHNTNTQYDSLRQCVSSSDSEHSQYDSVILDLEQILAGSFLLNTDDLQVLFCSHNFE
jgi:hypothetical protein